MSKRLGEEDAAAVDLLLDRTSDSAQSGLGTSNVRSLGDARLPERLRAAEKVLSLLGAHPTQEPDCDLAARTLRHILTGVDSARQSEEQPGLDFRGPIA